jgi:hypothetical protein
MAFKIDTLNGHDETIVNEFNKTAKHFDDHDLLEIILTRWVDDADLKGITDTLKTKLEEINLVDTN